MVRDNTRRAFLKSIGVASFAGVFAGCTQDGGDNLGSAAQQTTKPATTTATQATTDISALSAEEWRKHASREAEKELQGNQELLFYTATRSEDYRDNLANAEYSGVCEPLNSKLNQSTATSSKLESRFQREMKTGSTTNVDLIDASPIDLMGESLFLDLSGVPSFQEAPDSVCLRPYIGAQYMYAQGIAYNTDRVSNPPQSYEDLLSDRFAASEIAADMTPTAKVVAAFYTQHGRDFVKKLGTQNMKFIDSKFAMAKSTATGETKISLLPLLPHVQSLKNDGLPIEYVPNNTLYWNTKTIEASAKASHPWAAKLWIDWLMHPDRANLQSTRPGAVSIDGSKAKPQNLAKLFDPEKQEVWIGDEFDRPPAEIQRDYLKAIGAPVE